MKSNVKLVNRAMLNDRIRLTVFDDGSVVLRDIALDEAFVFAPDEIDEVNRFIIRNTK